MAAWVDKEAPHYNYAVPSYGDDVGHFTQARGACSWCRLRCRQAGCYSAKPVHEGVVEHVSDSAALCKPTDCMGVDDGSGLRTRGRLRGWRWPRCRVGAGPVRLQVQPTGQRSEHGRVCGQRAPAGGAASRQQRLTAAQGLAGLVSAGASLHCQGVADQWSMFAGTRPMRR